MFKPLLRTKQSDPAKLDGFVQAAKAFQPHRHGEPVGLAVRWWRTWGVATDGGLGVGHGTCECQEPVPVLFVEHAWHQHYQQLYFSRACGCPVLQLCSWRHQCCAVPLTCSTTVYLQARLRCPLWSPLLMRWKRNCGRGRCRV